MFLLFLSVLEGKIVRGENLNNAPLISIIVPVYNVQLYLEKCLYSLIQQSYKNIEIILVNDGSTDDSLSICNAFALNDSRIKVINQKNLGVAKARINGFEQSSGEFIMFVDSDDYVSIEIVELMYQAHQKYRVDLVSCQYYDVIDNQVFSTLVRPSTGYYNRQRIIELLKNKFLHDSNIDMSGMTGYLCGRFFKRSYVDLILEAGRGLIYSEDQVGLFAALCNIDSMYIMEQPLYYYVQRSGQATKSYHANYWKNFELYFERLDALDKHCYLKQQIFNRALSMIRLLVKMEFDRCDGTFFEKLRSCNKNFSNKIFLLAKSSDSIGLNKKEKIQRILILYKQIFLYGVLLYLNRRIKYIMSCKVSKLIMKGLI